jgi:hypothetical protein
MIFSPEYNLPTCAPIFEAPVANQVISNFLLENQMIFDNEDLFNFLTSPSAPRTELLRRMQQEIFIINHRYISQKYD